ncbi:MAG: hypothetical protein R3A79_02205 [Nannocystaceae bacterium]
MGATVGVAAAAAVATSTSATAASPRPSQRERVELLLAPALAGDALSGWQIASAGGVRLGAVPIEMRTPSGASFHVELLRRDGDGPQAIAETEHFALFVINRGDGATVTDEVQGRGVLALRRYLARREIEIAAAGLALPEVMTLRERDRAYPDGHFSPRA